jgi:hypothetical protein
MPDIIDLNATAANGDRLGFQWINAVRAKFIALDAQLAVANQTINQLRSETAQAFRVSVVSALNLSYTGGAVKLPSGLIATVAPGNITAPNNAVSFVFVNASGAIAISTTRPALGFEIARVEASNGAVTQLQNYPLFAVRPVDPDLSNYATVDYANSRAWKIQALGRKTSTFAIASTDTYYRIPLESLTGSGFATNGLFTAPVAGNYVFASRIRVDTTTPNQPLAVKLSLYVGSTEILLHQGDSAYGDLSASVQNNEPVPLAVGGQADMRVYLTRGVNARVREGSSVVAWLVS